MSTVNKVILIGNVGADPELRYTAGGKAVAEIRMATSEKYGDTETTEWHRVIVWEKLAEIVGQYVHKGSKIFIEGRIQTRSYDDKDGNKRYITEIVARDMRMLDKRGDGGTSEADDTEDRPAETPPKRRRGRPKKAATPNTDTEGLNADDPSTW